MKTNHRKINKVINPDYNLQKCDNLINEWSKELMTVFAGQCKKEWKPGQHLIVKKDKWDTHRIMIFSTNNSLINSAVELASYTPNTIIAWPDRNRLYFSFYGKRRLPTSYNYFEKIDNKSFLAYNGEKEDIFTYRAFQTDIGKTFNENECFNNTSLYGQMIKFFKNDISIKRKGGQAKSAKKTAANKAHGFQPSYMCKLDFENGYGWAQDIKTILDSYKIAAGKYGYKKCFKSFKNDIKKGELRIDNGKSTLSVNLLPAKAVGFTQPTINITTILNDVDLKSGLNLKTKESLFIVGGVNPTIEQSSKGKQSISELETKELQFIVNAQVQKGKQSISELEPEEKWPENYQAFQKPRKTGTNSEKYLKIIENIDNDDVVLDDDLIKELFSSEDEEDIHVVTATNNNIATCGTTEPKNENPKYIHVVTTPPINKDIHDTTDTNYNAATLKEYEIYVKGCPEGYALSIEEWYSYSKD